MQDVAVSLTDGPFHSGSAQALYHPNHQVSKTSLGCLGRQFQGGCGWGWREFTHFFFRFGLSLALLK